MARLDMTLGKALYKDVFGTEPSTDNNQTVRELQTAALSIATVEACEDWKRLVQHEGGVFTDSAWLYPDWTGHHCMDSPL